MECYLVANLGPGPRDGLMTNLTRVTNLPIAFIRASIEISVVLMAGILEEILFGIGTIIFDKGIITRSCSQFIFSTQDLNLL